MVELLSPVGDFECLKAAVQNGANSVYFGGTKFNARENATNFNDDNLKQAIQYAKLRNVKVDFTLNTLIKEDEFEDALNLINKIYQYGADAVIVQDLGLAKYIIDNFPGLHVHASTQMTIHNLDGVLQCEKMGFKRVVLSRELSLHEIEYICKNSNIEIETFVHGAICISYSGQCLLSSSIGARSGNRGKCAQPCRLPYKLYENKDKIDEGYLLSTRDLCSLEFLPDLIKAGVKCFKIEGRMKTPEYVATCTRIYRKYIDLAINDPENYKIDDDDIKDLMQVFNRGGFSTGNLKSSANFDYVYKVKPNNMGIYIGNVSNFNNKKGLITFKTNEKLHIGDRISFQKEEHKYTVSELMKNGVNIKEANIDETITIGRMKGNINLGDKVYKLSDKIKSQEVIKNYNKENIKIPLIAFIKIKKGKPIELEVTSEDTSYGIYFSMSSKKKANIIPIDALSRPITEDKIREQLTKTQNEIFQFHKIITEIDDNVFVPKISVINELRREVISDLKEQAIKRIERNNTQSQFENDRKILAINDDIMDNINKKDLINNIVVDNLSKDEDNNSNKEKIKDDTKTNGNVNLNVKNEELCIISKKEKSRICLLLNKINLKYNYKNLDNVEKIYVPLKYFIDKDYQNILKSLSIKSNLYIYLPTILKDNFKNILLNNMENIVKIFNIKGLVLSNLSYKNCFNEFESKLELVANYTYNVFNTKTIDELKKMNFDVVTISPELDQNSMRELCQKSSLKTELMVYGRLPVMTSGYCLLGKSNKCYPECKMMCKNSDSNFYIKDRLNMNYKISIDNMQTVTTIYNNRITSINYKNIKPSFARVSILDETIDEINEVIEEVKNDKMFSGEDYTKLNLNKLV